MRNFFSSWHGSSASTSQAPSDCLDQRFSSTRPNVDFDSILESSRKLKGDTELPPFVRPLVEVLTSLAEVLSSCFCILGPAGSVGLAAEGALAVLEKSAASGWQLEFALGAHGEANTAPQATLRSLELELAHFAAQPPANNTNSSTTDLHDLSTRWREGLRALCECCREAWELHAYFVFLDIKGDRALAAQTARRLCRLLGLPARDLQTSFANTGSWATVALGNLSRRESGPMLERLHKESLQLWQKEWQERLRNAQEEQNHGLKFWESYFTHLFKISWPDFVEAFEHFYLLDHCPLDIMNQLRLRVDPTRTHHVSKAAWQRLLGERTRIVDVMSMFLDEVYEDVGSFIYRKGPVGSSQVCPLSTVGRTASEVCPGGTGAVEGVDASGSTSASATAPSSPQCKAPALLADPRPRPWFPFKPTTVDDGDMAIPTPHELPVRHAQEQPYASETSGHQAWDNFVSQLFMNHRPPWETEAELTTSLTSEHEPLRLAASRSVNGNVACTSRALIFRVVSGDLAHGRPVLELPRRRSRPTADRTSRGPTEDNSSEAQLLPALVVLANGNRFGGVTKFGRSSTRRTLLPDCPMSEAIASRSHFNVVHDQELDQYCLMDAGSKWGTFVKIGTDASVTLSCGDWIRVGGVEFIIRYCGGGCDCRQRHAHYRLHSLRLLREHQGPPAVGAHYRLHSLKLLREHQGPLAVGAGRSRDNRGLFHRQPSSGAGSANSYLPEPNVETTNADSSEEDRPRQMQDELLLLLSSRRPRGWTASSARYCQQGALLRGGASEDHNDSDIARRPSMVHTRRNSHESDMRLRTWTDDQSERPVPEYESVDVNSSHQPSVVPIAPLELDFISGPRMGEKLVLCERFCTLGRGESNIIQVSDSQLASVSRVHCIFEYSGNRWHMRDNGSTNGTWRRLSCVLEPSASLPLSEGMSIQAGAHEFLIEEAEMKHCWVPSFAKELFDELAAETDS